MVARSKMVLVVLASVCALVFVAGPAARPATVRADVQPLAQCQRIWNATIRMWCYRCCDIFGCHYEYCE